MISESAPSLRAFQWAPQPAAEQLVGQLLERYLDCTPAAAALVKRMRDQTGTRLLDWADHLVVPHASEIEQQLIAAGFALQPQPMADRCFVHDGGLFPRILLGSEPQMALAFRVESLPDFAAANGLQMAVAEAPLSLYRRLLVSRTASSSLWAIERHGYPGFAPPPWSDIKRLAMLRRLEQFRTRRRDFADDIEGFEHLTGLVRHAIDDCGADVTCDLFFAAEREYWQRRNRAAQVQKARQDKLGLGWANHDHHTYRSSRESFTRLIALLETLSFRCRERFYAGAEAGWGAQVLEQPAAGIVVFADVDLGTDEVLTDFAHEPLPPRDALGTVGLWCALHGEAMLQAGMHHLECQFDFERLAQQLETAAAIRTMPPFTNLPYLRQAFTEGERWPVSEARLRALLARRQITAEQADRFRREGALGSHLENLQRDQGYKGFNQQGVSRIIAETDPRNRSNAPALSIPGA
jgi:hypothetical protein